VKVSYLKTGKLVTIPIEDEDAVAKLAAQLLKDTGKDQALPGFELSDDDNKHGTLAAAVAPFGWALVHTSQDHLVQHCTQNSGVAEESIDVQWDEVTSIPKKWFIPQKQAMAGIRQWMQDGTLSPSVHWSDQCY